ncbi:MAG: hypothetical protein L3J19_06085 [Sulfurimonas sp.]|nr:hypothetical protein [Sulfurimonas sp.]
MIKELTQAFTKEVLKLNSHYVARYNHGYNNIEIINSEENSVEYMNIHTFVYTHCRDYLIGYTNGFKTVSETTHSDLDARIVILTFNLYITVPNLLNTVNRYHTETFSGLSEMKIYVDAIEWLMQYRKNTPQLSKFWLDRYR